jgi:hypothetical protein
MHVKDVALNLKGNYESTNAKTSPKRDQEVRIDFFLSGFSFAPLLNLRLKGIKTVLPP